MQIVRATKKLLHMKMTKLAIATFATVFGFCIAASADDVKAAASASLPPASAKSGVTFAADIKPIVDASCVKCHSGVKPKAGLKLDSLDGALKGTKNGLVIVAGDSVKSIFVLSVAHVGNPDSFMPKGKGAKPLTPEQIGLIRAWIDQGAK